jgi:DNA modification methylase
MPKRPPKQAAGVTWVATRDIPIRDLTRFPGNARRGNVAEIRKSIRRHGQYRAIVVRDCPDGLVILAGNHTRDALEAEGRETARCEVIQCTDDEARRIAIADNRLSDIALDDNDALVELLSYLDGDYEGTGWDAEAVEALLTPPEPEPPKGDPDKTPEPPAIPVTQPGDIWLLGPHRIICGDCRDHGTVERLLGGEPVNVAFTSPPYASQRAYDESSGFKPIPPDEYADWFEDVQANVRAHLAEDGSWFVNIKENSEDGQRVLYVKDLVIAHVRAWGWLWVEELCWLRKALPGSPESMRRFKNAFEPIFQFAASSAWKFRPAAVMHESDAAFSYEDQKAAGKRITASAQGDGGGIMDPVGKGEGMAYPSNVLDIKGGANVVGHTAAYPVALPQWFIRAYSDTGDVVFDPFMGSGTTLIAAHLENRTAYGCEISPAYCDVILKRFQDLTGIKPERVLDDGTTETVSFAT